MKKKIYPIAAVLALATSIFVVGCDKDEIPEPSYRPGAWFYQSAASSSLNKFHEKFSSSFTFYFTPAETTTDTFELPMVRVMGTKTDYDRKIKLVAVADSSTAVEGVHYEFGNLTLPANELTFQPTVILLRNNLKDEKELTLYLQLQPNEDFPAPIRVDSISEDRTFFISTHYKLTFSDLIQEPPYWEDLGYFWRKWGRVKYEFMVEKLGIYLGVEKPKPEEYNTLYNYYLRMRYETQKYKEEHGEPLLDENGQTIYF